MTAKTSKMIALDWRAMKVFQIRALLLPVFILLLGIYTPLAIIPMSVIMLLSFSVNPFAVEEKGDLNALYLTLPVERKSIVTGRYLLSIIMMLCGIALGSASMPILNKIAISKWFIGFEGYIALISLSYLIYAVLNLFMFPVLFKLGYNKGKFWGFYLPMVFFTIIYGAYTGFTSFPENQKLVFDFFVYARDNLLIVSGCVAVAATIILLASYMISVRIYSKRDF